MISPSIDLCWSIAEAEAAMAGHKDIQPGHFWIGAVKCLDLGLPMLLGNAPPEMRDLEGQIEADFQEIRVGLEAAGLDPTAFRRATRAELGKAGEVQARPLHRSQSLRDAFKRAFQVAQDQRTRVRPAHLLAAMLNGPDSAILSKAMSGLALDPKDTLSKLRKHFSAAIGPVKKQRGKVKPPEREKELEEPEKPTKPTALEKFGRDLTALAAAGALSPIIGRLKELLKMTQVLLQSRKNNLILLGEPGVGKTGVVEGFAQLVADGKLPAELGRPSIIEISLTSLVAGTKYRGEFEQRLEAVIKEAEVEPKPILFHDEKHLLRFDMSEYMEQHAVAKLIGAPPGYIGHDEGGQLTDKIRTHPYSVVLFDEIEKAHPKVLDLFLQIFDEGTLTDSHGRACSFKDAVIVLTSNLGTAAEEPAKQMGFGAAGGEGPDGESTRQDAILAAVRQHLRPELVNRFTRIISFNPLG